MVNLLSYTKFIIISDSFTQQMNERFYALEKGCIPLFQETIYTKLKHLDYFTFDNKKDLLTTYSKLNNTNLTKIKKKLNILIKKINSFNSQSIWRYYKKKIKL